MSTGVNFSQASGYNRIICVYKMQNILLFPLVIEYVHIGVGSNVVCSTMIGNC